MCPCFFINFILFYNPPPQKKRVKYKIIYNIIQMIYIKSVFQVADPLSTCMYRILKVQILGNSQNKVTFFNSRVHKALTPPPVELNGPWKKKLNKSFFALMVRPYPPPWHGH